MSTMAWPDCGNSISCPHEYSVFPHPPNQFFFLHRPTSASTFSPVLSFTNMAAFSNTASCAAPVSLSVWVLPPRATPTPRTAALLSLSILVGGGWFCYLVPLTHHRLHRLAIYVYLMGGGGVDTWSPSRSPDFSVYVFPAGYWINVLTRPLLYYLDNVSLVLVMDE